MSMSINQIESTLHSWFKLFLNHPSDIYLDHKSTRGPAYCSNTSGFPHSVLLRITAIFLGLLRLRRWHTFWFMVTIENCLHTALKGENVLLGKTQALTFAAKASRSLQNHSLSYPSLTKAFTIRTVQVICLSPYIYI